MNNSTTGVKDTRDEELAKVEVALLAIIFAVTVVGNLLVLVALLVLRRQKLSRMYYFIVHLSIADLLTAFFTVLPQLGWDVTYRFVGGNALCKFVKFSQTQGLYLSSYVLVVTAMDRYWAVCSPIEYSSWSFRRVKIMVAIAWATSLILSIPQACLFAFQEVPDKKDVWDCLPSFAEYWGEKAYVTWYFMVVLIVPLVVLVFTYSCICRKIWRHKFTRLSSTQSSSPLISRAKINSVKQMVVVILLYIICSTPYTCVILAYVWDPTAEDKPFFKGSAYVLLNLLFSLNSCVNPFIYLAFNKELVSLLLNRRDSKLYNRGSSSSKERSRFQKFLLARS